MCTTQDSLQLNKKIVVLPNALVCTTIFYVCDTFSEPMKAEPVPLSHNKFQPADFSKKLGASL